MQRRCVYHILHNLYTGSVIHKSKYFGEDQNTFNFKSLKLDRNLFKFASI